MEELTRTSLSTNVFPCIWGGSDPDVGTVTLMLNVP